MTHQLTLDQALQARKLAKRTDPATSRLAAEEMVASGELNRQQRVALEYVRKYPGATTWEMAGGNAVIRYMLNRRLPELARLKEDGGPELVKRGEDRRCQFSYRASTTWWPKEKED